MTTSSQNIPSASSFARPFVAGVVAAVSLAGGAVALGQATADSAREAAAMAGMEVPEWKLSDLALPDDIFTFARVRYLNGGKWTTDFPGSDLHLSFRLHQLTSLDVNPDPALVELTDASLSDYPMLYMANPHHGGNNWWSMSDAFDLSEDEGQKLRNYLLNGGFLWIDDFWGRDMWEHFQEVIKKRVFPKREPVLLDFSHPIFHNIFELDKIPQVPSHNAWDNTEYAGTAEKTYEWDMDPDDPEYLEVPRFMAYFDDDGRMCMLVDVNNDIGDGWEEEGYKTWYFNAFSEKYCFPMAINVLFYVMTN
ncbi:MAG: DUF4159 domain-containing protein [Verrucomicrobiales bacterium]